MFWPKKTIIEQCKSFYILLWRQILLAWRPLKVRYQPQKHTRKDWKSKIGLIGNGSINVQDPFQLYRRRAVRYAYITGLGRISPYLCFPPIPESVLVYHIGGYRKQWSCHSCSRSICQASDSRSDPDSWKVKHGMPSGLWKVSIYFSSLQRL